MIRRPGARIGDWVVESTLGAGGMGTVFRCHNALAERIRAAVKVLRPDDSEDFRERFIREVEALEQLEHPAIVRVKGWGQDEEGWLWLAMDLVDGRDLGACLGSGALTVDQATAVFTDLAEGLAHAHSRNVFHRDIKPANILLQSGSPAAKLVDFGIAMQGGRTRLSTAGLVPGTPAYLAPEVFGGTPHPQLLDVYALGQVLYECLTGTPAFPEPNGMTTTARIAHVAGSKLRQQPLDPGDVPEHLRQLVRRATHPDPTKRVQDMETFASALRGEVLAEPVAAAATLHFDLDSVEPAPPAPPEPVPAPPRPPAIPAGRWAFRAVLGVGFLSLFALPAILLLGGSAPTRVIVTGVDAATPVLVRMNGQVVEGQGNAFSATGLNGPITVEVIGGTRCDLQAWTGLCESCCACITQTIEPGTSTPIELNAPSGIRAVHLLAADGLAPAEQRAWVDDRPAAPGPDGHLALQVEPGIHSVVLERGSCPELARGCGESCPPGCLSVEQSVEVSCGTEPLEVHVAIAALTDPQAEASPPAPRANPYPALDGVKIRILYMPKEVETAFKAVDRLESYGAIVDVRSMPYSHFSDFGRISFWSPRFEDAARAIEKSLVRLGTAQYRPPIKKVPDGLEVDIVVWFKAP